MVPNRAFRVSHRLSGFTLVELMTAVAIIAILVGLVFGIAGYAMRKASQIASPTKASNRL